MSCSHASMVHVGYYMYVCSIINLINNNNNNKAFIAPIDSKLSSRHLIPYVAPIYRLCSCASICRKMNSISDQQIHHRPVIPSQNLVFTHTWMYYTTILSMTQVQINECGWQWSSYLNCSAILKTDCRYSIVVLNNKVIK